jgi:predicted metal-binding membrane protein
MTPMMTAERPSQHAFVGVSALLFLSSAALTIAWGLSMSDMGGMSMPGGWTMSMTWMRMPGQTWSAAAASFLGMWTVMMVAMMLPSLTPMLLRYRESVSRTAAAAGLPLGKLTTLVGVGYFFVWTVIGAIAFPLGVVLANIEMQHSAVSQAVPIAAGLIVLTAGAIQFTAWKRRQLAGHLDDHATPMPADAGTAWRHGLRLGLHCTWCCANLMAILFVLGVMDLAPMAVVTILMTVERLAPASARIARLIGVAVIATGVLLIAAR